MNLNSSAALIFSGIFILATSIACSGGGSGGGGGGTATNKFSAAGRDMTLSDLAPETRSGSEEYHGSFLYKNGGNFASGSFHFILENDGTNVKFKSFSFGKVVETSTFPATPTEVTAGVTCFSNVVDPATNMIVMTDSTRREVRLDLDLGVTCNADIADLTNVGILFSSDFSTFVGGDNATFFMIAQKASASPTYAASNIAGVLNMFWFSIDVNGVFVEEPDYDGSVTVSGTSWSAGENSGTLKATDSTSGGFLYKYITTPANNIDGGFLVSPDKNFVMGIDLIEDVYFAASK
jgi:hypothetical protein